MTTSTNTSHFLFRVNASRFSAVSTIVDLLNTISTHVAIHVSFGFAIFVSCVISTNCTPEIPKMSRTVRFINSIRMGMIFVSTRKLGFPIRRRSMRIFFKLCCSFGHIVSPTENIKQIKAYQFIDI